MTCAVLLTLYSDWRVDGQRLQGWGDTTTSYCDWSGIYCNAACNVTVLMPPSNLTGTIPATLGQLNSLTSLFLYNNPGLEGTIPATLGQLTSLRQLYLYNNLGLEGGIPASIANCASLTQFYAFNTGLSGQLPAFPAQLTDLFLHNCRFSGTMPSLSHMTLLQQFAVFGNGIGGHLALPPQAGRMSVLLLHDNHLSCRIEMAGNAAGLSFQNTTNLLLPGNVFSGPASQVPSWFSMHAASFLYADSVWHVWRVEILLVVCGIIVLLILVCRAMGRDEVLPFFLFTPSHHVEELELFSSKLMACSCLWAVGLVPLYILAPRYVECGKEWLYATIVYIDHEAVEWGVATAACLFPIGAIWAIHALEQHATKHAASSPTEARSCSWGQLGKIWLLWTGIVILTSAPQALYIISTTLAPGENVMHLSTFALDIVHHAAPFILFFIGAYILPGAARRIVRMVDKDNEDPIMATKLIMVGRFMTGIGIPFACVVLLSNDCSGSWRSLWTKCADYPASFDANATIRVLGGYGWEKVGIPVVSHAEICSPQYKGGGRCPRAVVDVLGTLIFRKLIDDAFLSPVISMVKLMPAIQGTWVCICRLCRPGYRSTKSIDREVRKLITTLEPTLSLTLPPTPK